MSIMNLRPGAMVQALKDLDPEGANVKTGDFGVVFCESGRADCAAPHYIACRNGRVDGACCGTKPYGPLVRWIRTQEDCPRGCKYHKCMGMSEHGPYGTADGWDHVMGGVCNVYDGDVVEVKRE